MRLSTTFFLAFTALLPLINPLGSALVLLGLIGDAPSSVYRSLARKIAINNVIFLAVIDLFGSAILKFFGISLPIVQVSGGLVIVGLGWSLLNQKDSGASTREKTAEAGTRPNEMTRADLEARAFYPFTFPVTSGPGTLVVTLTLSARDSSSVLTVDILGHVGLLLAVTALSVLVYFCYAYAPRLTAAFPATTVNGVLRVMAFIVVCIGFQIAWNGLIALIATK